ncbi:MAG: DUF6069 family protein [Bacteroidota bacterium]
MKLQLKSLFRPMGLTILVSVILNILIFYIGQNTGFISKALPVLSDGSPIGLPAVVLASVFPVFVATLLLWVLSFVLKKYRVIFSVICFVVLFLSFATPFSIPNVPVKMAMTLNLMHIVVAGSVFYFLTKK